jgi:hypothetical protein
MQSRRVKDDVGVSKQTRQHVNDMLGGRDAVRGGQSMPAGFKYNVDLLLDSRDREALAARFPQFMFAFDDPDLRALFEQVDLEATKAKRRSRTFGVTGVVLVSLGLIIGSFSTLLMPLFRIAVTIAAVIAVIGLLVGWIGVMTSRSRDEWLRQRYVCERIRQLHFQTLTGWGPLIIDCARKGDPKEFLSARQARTEKFRSQVVNASAVKLADVLADRQTENVWLVDPDERAPGDDTLAAKYFEALEELRLGHQANFAGLQLLSFWTLSPKSPLQMAKLLSGIGAFCAVLLLTLGVVGLVLDAATERLASLTHATLVSLAVVALAARTLEEGLQVHSEVGRYRTYDAALRRLRERYREAASNGDKRNVLLELEEICFDEMVGFLKSHHDARFLM